MFRGLATTTTKPVKGIKLGHTGCGITAAAPARHCQPQRRNLAGRVAEREPLVRPTPNRPDANGRYGQYGGKYVPETLM